jgi:hypothetical protein
MMTNSNAFDLKSWIYTHLCINGKLISKRCNESWFIKYDHISIYTKIVSSTTFLDQINPKFACRLWYIYNDVYDLITCHVHGCNNTPSFVSFTTGYLRTCSLRCAQLDEQTSTKIQNTNLLRYGCKYGLSNIEIRNKIKVSVKKKYGVINVSQHDSIKLKKEETCLSNHGVKHFLSKQSEKEKHVIQKYGVSNVMKVDCVKQRMVSTKQKNNYRIFISTDRFKGRVTPLFTEDQYMGVEDKEYEFRCCKCKSEFHSKMEDGDIPRCYNCYPTNGTSLFESEIHEYIQQLTTDELHQNDRSILNGKELDIYIPNKNIAVECNGLYWHGEVSGNKQRKYHLEKTIACETRNIQLIHIFDDEWIYKQDVVKSKLSNIIGGSSDSIFARKCNVREIDASICGEFLDKYHIQGKSNSKIKMGLFYENELISVMTFGSLRVALGKRSNEACYELVRFCSSARVVGGASKLLKHFIRKYSPSQLITYADRRWTYSKSNLYNSIGFTKVSDGCPNYWYFGKGANYKRHHRFGFAKHKLSTKLTEFNPSMSEWQNMQINGYDRIWDCGNLKYIIDF